MMTRSEPLKVILFGAGEAARRALPRLSSRVEVLAIADNDPKKHGTQFLGYPVIPPAQIRDFPYTCIVVASLYAGAITTQLLELGVAEEDIEYPPVAPSMAARDFWFPARWHALAWPAAGLLVGAALGAWLA